MLAEGLYDAVAGGQYSVVTIGNIEYVFNFGRAVKGIDIPDKIAISGDWIESKTLGKGTLDHQRKRKRVLTQEELGVVMECVEIATAHPQPRNLNYNPGERIAESILQRFDLN